MYHRAPGTCPDCHYKHQAQNYQQDIDEQSGRFHQDDEKQPGTHSMKGSMHHTTIHNFRRNVAHFLAVVRWKPVE
jgi:hypothetical protein